MQVGKKVWPSLYYLQKKSQAQTASGLNIKLCQELLV
jgi:hypothetical protein